MLRIPCVWASYALLLTVILSLDHLFAQKYQSETILTAPPSTIELKINDVMPDYYFSEVLGIPGNSMKLSDFKGKMIIFDFWATNCSGCIALLPELSELQSRYKDRIQIIPITNEKSEKVASFLKRNKKLAGLDLPFVTGDTILQKIFPHNIISHEVWLNVNHVVKAITIPQYVSASNIEAFLQNSNVDWPVKNDNLKFDPSLPLVNHAGLKLSLKPSPLYYSIISKYYSGIGSDEKVIADSSNETKRLTFFNYPIKNLYSRAMQSNLPTLTNRTIYNVREVNRYIYDKRVDYADSWNAKNTFCYEAVYPIKEKDSTLYMKLKIDLDNYFSLSTKIENRLVDCFVITKEKDMPRHKGNTGEDTDIKVESVDSLRFQVSLKNAAFQNLVFNLNKMIGMPPVLDESKYSDLVNMKFEINPNSNYQELKDSLKKLGLKLNSQKRELPMFIISENN